MAEITRPENIPYGILKIVDGPGTVLGRSPDDLWIGFVRRPFGLREKYGLLSPGASLARCPDVTYSLGWYPYDSKNKLVLPPRRHLH